MESAGPARFVGCRCTEFPVPPDAVKQAAKAAQ
jgi:hypothetical protein